MNNQTKGPVWAVSNRPDESDKLDRIKASDGRNVAFIPDHEHTHAEEQANAALLAATYTSYDKAGRELGIDACLLAQTIDVAKLCRLARRIQDLSGGNWDKLKAEADAALGE